jgi:hypothetical protein
LVVAFAVSIALHEIVAGFIPAAVPPPEPSREKVSQMTIVRLTPRPSPTPKPTPTPPPKYVHYSAVASAPAPREVTHRAAQARPRIPETHAIPTSAAPVPTGGQGAGAGDAAPGAGSPGTGGTGNGAGVTAPCGAVTFSDPHGSHFDSGTRGFFVDIRLTVHFPDGHAESQILDYPFYYASEATNPWSERNRSNPDFPTLLQRPPEALAAGEPPLVQYVVQHTSSDGFTLLDDCPGSH